MFRETYVMDVCKVMDLYYAIVRTSPVYLLLFWSPLQGDFIPRLYLFEAYGEKFALLYDVYGENYRISFAHIVYILCLLHVSRLSIYSCIPCWRISLRGSFPQKLCLA